MEVPVLLDLVPPPCNLLPFLPPSDDGVGLPTCNTGQFNVTTFRYLQLFCWRNNDSWLFLKIFR